jgi:hypothetical protein
MQAYAHWLLGTAAENILAFPPFFVFGAGFSHTPLARSI